VPHRLGRRREPVDEFVNHFLSVQKLLKKLD